MLSKNAAGELCFWVQSQLWVLPTTLHPRRDSVVVKLSAQNAASAAGSADIGPLSGSLPAQSVLLYTADSSSSLGLGEKRAKVVSNPITKSIKYIFLIAIDLIEIQRLWKTLKVGSLACKWI